MYNSGFNVIIEGFTSNTYVMVITTDAIMPAMTLTNLMAARSSFEHLLTHLSEDSMPNAALND
jgi:hypothetical protein